MKSSNRRICRLTLFYHTVLICRTKSEIGNQKPCLAKGVSTGSDALFGRFGRFGAFEFRTRGSMVFNAPAGAVPLASSGGPHKLMFSNKSCG